MQFQNTRRGLGRSYALCRLQYRFPILVDAATAAVARKGDVFLARWAEIMTGRGPKVRRGEGDSPVSVCVCMCVCVRVCAFV